MQPDIAEYVCMQESFFITSAAFKSICFSTLLIALGFSSLQKRVVEKEGLFTISVLVKTRMFIYKSVGKKKWVDPKVSYNNSILSMRARVEALHCVSVLSSLTEQQFLNSFKQSIVTQTNDCTTGYLRCLCIKKQNHSIHVKDESMLKSRNSIFVYIIIAPVFSILI